MMKLAGAIQNKNFQTRTKSIWWFAVLFSVTVACASANADALTIVENGRSDYVIALSGDAAEAAKAHPRSTSDMSGVLASLLAFREKHRDFLVDGALVSEFEPLEPAQSVFGVFRRNPKGEMALVVCATSIEKQVIRFRFPGSDRIESRELGLCSLHLFKEGC